MQIFRIFKTAFLGCLLTGIAVSAHATSFTYNFTYSGVGTFDNTVHATGTGSLTYSATAGSTTATLTGFAFTDTLSSPTLGSSIYNYLGLSSVGSDSVQVNATTGLLSSVNVATNFVTGSDGALGGVKFNLQFSGATNDSTADSNGTGSFLQAFTSGGGTTTLATNVAPTPEPSSFVLLGSGILGLAGFARRKLAKA